VRHEARAGKRRGELGEGGVGLAGQPDPDGGFRLRSSVGGGVRGRGQRQEKEQHFMKQPPGARGF
jgi:hypothetical protein